MNEEEIKKTAVEAEGAYNTLDEAVSALEAYKRMGDNVYINFSDKKLYSLLDDRDSCYTKVTGEDYETYTGHLEEEERNFRIERLQDELEALKKIPDWQRRGYALIYPQQKKEWDKCVKARASDLYFGSDLENALEIMESLAKDGDMEKAYQIYQDANHSGMSASVVISIVASFSDKGTQFYRYAYAKEGVKLDIEDEKYLRKIDAKFISYQAENEDL